VPALPILSIVACVWLMLNLTGLTWIRFGIWMALGRRQAAASSGFTKQ
jgi:basic amino acid/polyamine antiporter, APA family